MKPYILCILLLVPYISSLSQTTTSLRAGIGATTSTKMSLVPTPGLEFEVLGNISPRISVGAEAALQRFSFNKKINSVDGWHQNFYATVLSVSQKSTYLFISPKVNMEFGKRGKVSAYFSFGIGTLAGGNQTQSVYHSDPHPSPWGSVTAISTSQKNTTSNINSIMWRAQAGAMEVLGTVGRYTAFLFQEFSFLPGYISTPNGHYTTDRSDQIFLKVNYFAGGIGFRYRNHEKPKHE